MPPLSLCARCDLQYNKITSPLSLLAFQSQQVYDMANKERIHLLSYDYTSYPEKINCEALSSRVQTTKAREIYQGVFHCLMCLASLLSLTLQITISIFQVDLPTFQEFYRYAQQKMTPAEIRAYVKQKGIIPYRPDAPIVSLSDSG